MPNERPPALDCGCYFCRNGRLHPATHTVYFDVSHKLLVAESLDPRDGVPHNASVVCRGFSDHTAAVKWVRGEVEEAHGEIAYVIPSFTKLKFDFGGEPQSETRWMWTVISPGGPVWGMVIAVDQHQPDTEEVIGKVN